MAFNFLQSFHNCKSNFLFCGESSAQNYDFLPKRRTVHDWKVTMSVSVALLGAGWDVTFSARRHAGCCLLEADSSLYFLRIFIWSIPLFVKLVSHQTKDFRQSLRCKGFKLKYHLNVFIERFFWLRMNTHFSRKIFSSISFILQAEEISWHRMRSFSCCELGYLVLGCRQKRLIFLVIIVM
jgi:hypothetical protein